MKVSVSLAQGQETGERFENGKKDILLVKAATVASVMVWGS
jgi:hypothetical protein